MKISQVAVFTKTAHGGYSAVVVTDYFPENQLKMQQLATRLQSPVTVFIFPTAPGSDASARVRFFTAEAELLFCGAGVLAAASYLLAKVMQGNIKLQISQNSVISIIKNIDGLLQFTSPKVRIWDDNVPKEKIISMLGLPSEKKIEKSFPYGCVLSDSSRLLVPVKSQAILGSLQPDYQEIAKWNKKNKMNGIYVYTHDTIRRQSTFSVRSFNPCFGNNEEGNNTLAAAALAHLSFKIFGLDTPIIIEQGFYLNMPSRVVVSLDEKHNPLIGGYTYQANNAKELLKEKFLIPHQLKSKL